MNNETTFAPHSQLSIHNSPFIRPGYKQTEVGVIPEDWDVITLGGLAQLKNGYAFKSSTYTPLGGFKVVTIANVQDGYMDILECNRIASLPNDVQPHHRLEVGDVLISMTGNVGRVCRVTATHCVLNQRVGKLVPTNVDAQFLFHLLSENSFQVTMMGKAKGGAQGNLSVNDIIDFLFPIPPTKAEQEAVAEALSDEDALIESLEGLIAKKRQIKQGAMQELLTGKTRLPGFSGEWGEKSFGEIFDYYPTATNSRSDLDPAGDTYYIHYGDIHMRFHNHLDFSVEQPPRILRSRCRNAALLRNGDLVMADASEDYDGVGKSIEIQGLVNGVDAVSGLHTFLLREKSDTFVPGFKGHLANLESLHEQFLRVATGMKVFGVSKAALRDLVLPIPDRKEQAAITQILSDMDAQIAALETKLVKARQIKGGMMQELLTGRIRLISGELKMENGE